MRSQTFGMLHGELYKSLNNLQTDWKSWRDGQQAFPIFTLCHLIMSLCVKDVYLFGINASHVLQLPKATWMLAFQWAPSSEFLRSVPGRTCGLTCPLEAWVIWIGETYVICKLMCILYKCINHDKAISSINWFLMVSVLNLDVHQPNPLRCTQMKP